MTDATTQPPEGEQAPQTPEAPATAPTGEGEDWQKRMSGLQRAHNEETRVLRERIAALEVVSGQTTQQATQAVSASSDDAARWKALAEENARALAQERQQRIVDTRIAKYPFAAESLGDPGVLISMDEARLAGLNERLAPAAAPSKKTVMDPNGSGRSIAATDKPLKDKTEAELKDDLVKFAPDWVRQLQEAQGQGM